MADAARIREIVERVLADVFADKVPGLREAVIQRVLERAQPALAQLLEGGSTERLKASLAAIHEATAQSDILRALLDGAASFCGRAALFVVSGNSAVGWQARGLRENDAIKLLNLDLTVGLASQAFQQRVRVEGLAAQFEPRFVAGFGAPLDGTCVIVPLVIRDRVAALIYGDAGTQAAVSADASALEILARVAGAWIELLALRKLTAAQSVAPVLSVSVPDISPVAATAGPFPETPRLEEMASVPLAASAAAASALGSISVAPVPPPTAVEPSVAAASTDDEELHRKARRLAKLLVDEIKLYNRAKVAEGKKNGDLYNRLKDDIEKSRATYDKRYSQTSVASAGYFNQELIRNLADSNPNLLGGNFPG